ncbi:CTX-RELATED TYPE I TRANSMEMBRANE PROTEIN [Ceraceosorus bombacis]|uniref:CTX-RELATED TYPE I TRANSMEMBRANE PROTEIN n=1 Tax=Ceraceosorus bombacis TaxID=401625 RepID=A0A0P1BQH4_9BASI|nr:CTX-RELATED TYPE I TRANSMEMBRANE PROTEIN [Ceraceosorus bombacis]
MSDSSTATSSTASPENPDYSVFQNFSKGAIAGIVIGIVVAITLLALLLWFVIRRIRRRQRSTPLGSIERRARERAIAVARGNQSASTSEGGRMLTEEELALGHLKSSSSASRNAVARDLEFATGRNLSAGQAYAVGLDGRPTSAYTAQTASMMHGDPAAAQTEEFRDGEPWPPASLGGKNKRSARRQTQDQPPGQGACAHM